VSHRHVLALTAAAACWGLGAVASKRAVAEMAPTALLVIQLASSVVVLTLVRSRRGQPPGSRPALRLRALGMLNPGAAYLLSLAGLSTITVGLSVLLWALEPVLIVGLAWLAFDHRLTVRASSLMALAVAGAAVAGAAGVASADVVGVSLTVAAVACCAVYTVAASAWFRSESDLDIVVSQQRWALAFAVVAWTVLTGPSDGGGVAAAGGVAWLSALVSGIVYYGLAFWAFLAGLRRTIPATAAVYLNLIPLFGIGGGWILLGERFTPVQLLASLVVLSAVVGIGVAPSAGRELR